MTSLCDLTAVHLRSMRYMVLHMTKAQIDCLVNLNEEAVTILGSLHDWSEEQAIAFAEKYKQSQSNLASYAAMTSTHLTTLGHFLCGLSTADLETIKPEEYA